MLPALSLTTFQSHVTTFSNICLKAIVSLFQVWLYNILRLGNSDPLKKGKSILHYIM